MLHGEAKILIFLGKKKFFLYNKNIKMNCKLLNNINASCSASVGLADGLWMIPLDDVLDVGFSGNTRVDNSLFVTSIATNGSFYHVDTTSATMTSSMNGDNYQNSIAFKFPTLNSDVQRYFEEASSSRYLVAFRLIGSANHLLMGYREGVSVTANLSVETNSLYDVTISGTTSLPVLEMSSSCLDPSKVTFEGHYEPYYNDSNPLCNGLYSIATYCLWVNGAGQALDSGGKLVEYSGRPQKAMKLNGMPDGGYDIEDRYASGDTVDGQRVVRYDAKNCNGGSTGSISASTNEVTLTGEGTAVLLTITSTFPWSSNGRTEHFIPSKMNGQGGSTTVAIRGTNVCGTGVFDLTNMLTFEHYPITVHNYVINMEDNYLFDNGSTSVTFKIETCSDFTATSTSGTVTTTGNGYITVSNLPTSVNPQTFYVTVNVHGVSKTTKIKIKSIGPNPLVQTMGPNDPQTGTTAIGDGYAYNNP